MFIKRSAWVLGLVVTMSAFSFAGISDSKSISLTATVPETLTVTLSSNTVTFSNVTPTAPNNPGSGTITVTTKWSLKPATNALVLYAYFGSTTALANTGATFTIPTSAFQIDVNNTGAQSVSQSPAGHGVAGATLDLHSATINGSNKSGTWVDTLAFNLNLTSVTNLQADTYTGTLNIQADATP
jgi:hypothetical protein